MKKNIRIILLAGGKSIRFWPLSSKLTLKFLDQSLLEQQLQLIKNAGFSDIVLVGTKEITKRFAGRNLVAVEQKGKGQYAAILSVKKWLKNKEVIVLNANDVIDIALLKKLRTMTKGKHNILVGFKTNQYFPGGYLVLDGKRIAQVVEKPGKGKQPSNYVRLVCDYFHQGQELLKHADEVSKAHPDQAYEQLLSKLMQKGRIFQMMEYTGKWLPVKYPWHVLDLIEHYLSQIKKSHIHHAAKVHKTASLSGPIVLGKGVRVMEYAKLVGPLYIGAGSIVGNHSMVRYSMIGDHGVIGYGSDITRSYIGDNCWFHTNYIGDSVVDCDVAFGAGSVMANLRLDEGEIFSEINKQRINSHRHKLGVMIGKGSRIGIECKIMPGIKIGQNSIIGPGVILQQDVSNNQRLYLKQTYTIEHNPIKTSSDRDRFRKKI